MNHPNSSLFSNPDWPDAPLWAEARNFRPGLSSILYRSAVLQCGGAKARVYTEHRSILDGGEGFAWVELLDAGWHLPNLFLVLELSAEAMLTRNDPRNR